jgi:hypothetical protein
MRTAQCSHYCSNNKRNNLILQLNSRVKRQPEFERKFEPAMSAIFGSELPVTFAHLGVYLSHKLLTQF